MMRCQIGTYGSVELPDTLLRNLRAVHKDKVDPWLESLEPMLVELLEELDAHIAPGNPELSYHLVFFAHRSSGDAIVVKCTVPNGEQPPEVAGVEAMSQAGIGPRLILSDLDRGVLVMERIEPGNTLSTHIPTLAEDATIVGTIGTVANRMARDIDVAPWRDRLIPVREYSKALDLEDASSAVWKHHRYEIDRARELRDAMLLASPGRPEVFLHGDLHHYNILCDANDDPWVIDPKGLIGPAGYDFGVMTYDPIGIQQHPNLAALFRQRVTVWSEAGGLPWEEVRDWGFVAAVLSACWDGEDGGNGWHDTMLSALTIRNLSPPH